MEGMREQRGRVGIFFPSIWRKCNYGIIVFVHLIGFCWPAHVHNQCQRKHSFFIQLFVWFGLLPFCFNRTFIGPAGNEFDWFAAVPFPIYLTDMTDVVETHIGKFEDKSRDAGPGGRSDLTSCAEERRNCKPCRPYGTWNKSIYELRDFDSKIVCQTRNCRAVLPARWKVHRATP